MSGLTLFLHYVDRGMNEVLELEVCLALRVQGAQIEREILQRRSGYGTVVYCIFIDIPVLR